MSNQSNAADFQLGFMSGFFDPDHYNLALNRGLGRLISHYEGHQLGLTWMLLLQDKRQIQRRLSDK